MPQLRKVVLKTETYEESISADRRKCDLANRPQEASVAVLDLGVSLQAVLDHLEDAEPLDLRPIL
jgi:hypothetical protein